MDETEYDPERSPGDFVTVGDKLLYDPDPLPPALDATHDLVDATGRAMHALGRLADLPVGDPEVLVAPLVHRAAVEATAAGEDRVDLAGLFLDETSDRSAEPTDEEAARTGDDRSTGATDDETTAPVAEAANYLRAVRAGMAAVDSGRRLDGALVRELHEHVVTGVRRSGGDPGEYRTGAVEIGDDPDLVATPASNVPFRMEMLFEYVRDGGRHAPLVDVTLLRYQFLTIHPFLDGNGRTSRALATLDLYRRGLVPGPYLYLTAWVETNRRAFRDRILAVSRYGAWNEWIAFVLSGIRAQATTVYRTAQELGSLRDRYRERYRGSGPVTHELIDHLVAHPYTTPERAVEDVDQSRSTVAKAFVELEADGVVVPIDDEAADVVETTDDGGEAAGVVEPADDGAATDDGTGTDDGAAADDGGVETTDDDRLVRVPDVLAVVRTRSSAFGEAAGD